MFHVLIVEDDTKFRRNLINSLSMRFSSVAFEKATYSTETLAKIDTFRPVVVFMDIRLPGDTGLELTKKIKKLFQTISIIILTKYDYPELKRRFLTFSSAISKRMYHCWLSNAPMEQEAIRIADQIYA